MFPRDVRVIFALSRLYCNILQLNRVYSRGVFKERFIDKVDIPQGNRESRWRRRCRYKIRIPVKSSALARLYVFSSDLLFRLQFQT